jgi:hypothetical protein
MFERRWNAGLEDIYDIQSRIVDVFKFGTPSYDLTCIHTHCFIYLHM